MQRRANLQSDIINPYKGAPPGARPIYIFARNTDEAANKIQEVFNAYKQLLKLDKITIYEKDRELSSAVNLKQVSAEAEIILKTKGLEKSCVVWSTRMPIESKDETDEFVYTILTRTVSLLIIAIFPETPKIHIDILKSFDYRERIILWDEETEIMHNKIIIEGYMEEESEDVDDSPALQGSEQNEEKIDELNDELSSLIS
jgi:hypothetical protein